VYILGTCVKSQLTIDAWASFWVSILSHCHCFHVYASSMLF
jgi:hypothetical protein